MGGDRTCPDDCTPARRAAFRKTIAETLYKQNQTMEQIATQLGVSQQQISKDLVGLQPSSKPPRPKGGRPKGSKRAVSPGRGRAGQSQIGRPVELAIAKAVLDDGKSLAEAADEAGLKSDMVVRFAVAREQGRREAEPQITADMLSMTAQEKLDAAIRHHQRKLDSAFEDRVREESRKRYEELGLPFWKQKIEQAQKLYNKRSALMDKETFNTIRRALHPDSRNSISDKKLAEAFDKFMALEKYLLNEKDSPTHIADLPDDLAEWDKMRRATRRAASAGRTAVRPR